MLLALNATLKIAGLNAQRVVPIEEFFLDYFETALESGELLAEIQLPALSPRTGNAYNKFNVIESEMPTVGVAVSITLTPENGTCQDIRIALGASAPTPIRARQAEGLLEGQQVTDNLLGKAGEMAATEADPISDIHASADYRRELLRVMVGRVGREALARAKQG